MGNQRAHTRRQRQRDLQCQMWIWLPTYGCLGSVVFPKTRCEYSRSFKKYNATEMPKRLEIPGHRHIYQCLENAEFPNLYVNSYFFTIPEFVKTSMPTSRVEKANPEQLHIESEAEECERGWTLLHMAMSEARGFIKCATTNDMTVANLILAINKSSK